MQIKFISHSFHQQTKSTSFFIEFLQAFGTVSLSWDESWKPGGASADLSDAGGYDLVVVFQMEHTAIQAAMLGLRNLVFIPMYDSAKYLNSDQWKTLRSAKVLCFSSYLHEHIQRLGHRYSSYFQYYLNPQLLPEITDYSSRRGFLWQRRKEPSWYEIAKLLGTCQLDSFTLHCVLDPGEGDAVLPSPEEQKFHNIHISTWFERQNDLYDLLAQSNLYFAPRLDEGIGMSFIEALSMGMPVVANDAPTMNEYIVDGVNGFLYRSDKLSSLTLGNLDDHKAMGRRAREIAFFGYERWLSDQERLFDFLTQPMATLDSSKFYFAVPPNALAINSSATFNRQEALYQGGKRQSDTDSISPIVTVVTVVKNAHEDLLVTLSSILSQDMEKFEVLVIDGASDDGTLSSLRALDSTLDYWESCVDKGPYYAMNRAVSLARGQWILFMNAGDYFCSTSSLRQFYGNPPTDADFIVGHHIYFSAEGVEAVHRVRSFENTWSELRQGSLTNAWLTGIPCHQATLIRTELLKEYPFDTNYKIVADHDFMYRMRAKGKKFFVSPIISSYYRGGGLSWKNQAKCIEEWISTCKKHSENPVAVEKYFEPILVSTVLASLEMKNFGDWFKYLWIYPNLIVHKLAKNIFHNIEKKFISVDPSELYLDFRQANNNEFQAVIDGFSSEPWGCWTDGKIASIKFDRPFEGRVTLTLKCVHVFPPTLQSGAFIRIGNIDNAIPPKWKGGRLSLSLNLDQPISELDIIFNSPLSPKELGYSDEYRQLGLGLKYLRIAPN